MRVFVTGATGYIGDAVVRAFRNRGHTVLGLIRKENDVKELKRQEIEPVVGTLEDPDSYLPYIKKAEVFVHCAFEFSKEGVALDQRTLETLITFSQQLPLPRTLIYTSGCWVYGSTNGKWVDESSELNPLHLVKWRPKHEELVLKANNALLKAVVIRPGCVFGGRGGLTGNLFRAIEQGSPVIYGEGKQHWAMVHVDDLAELYVLAAERELPSLVLNGSDGRSASVMDCVNAVAASQKINVLPKKLSPEEMKQTFGSLAEGLLTDQFLSSQRAERLLGWKARHPHLIDQPGLYFEAWKAHQAP